MKKHLYFLAFTAFQGVLLSLLLAWGAFRAAERTGPSRSAVEEIVDKLGLTDFAIWTEARYTRHPSQADRFTPFQDFPSSLEHFPAGSIIAPPTGSTGTAGPFTNK